MLSGRYRTRLALILVAAAAVGLYGLPSMVSGDGSDPKQSSPDPKTAQSAYARLPMSFVPNHGQMPDGIGYGARGLGYSLGLAPDGAVFVFSKTARRGSSDRQPLDLLAGAGGDPAAEQSLLRMQLVGADPAARWHADMPLLGKANFLTGDDPGLWHIGIPTYGRVTYQAVYPGVDVSYHGNQSQFEYDFMVAPGTDPSVVTLGFPGAQGVRVGEGGELVLTVAGTEVRQHAPVIYQDGVDGRVPVSGGFVVRDDGNVGFAVAAYDQTRTLVIDPTLAYSTFLGSIAGDFGQGIAVDYLGNAYIAGTTASPNFPTTPGAYDANYNGDTDGFVAKLSPDGSALVYSTFLGGSDLDDADSVAVGLRGEAFVRGITTSPDFPSTPGAFDRSFNGSFDGYVVKLSPNGSALSYSTFLGGAGFDSGSGIAVDRRGAAYVAGVTGSPNFPTTAGAFDRTFTGVGGFLPPPVAPGDFDAFLTRVAPDGSTLEYSTFLGASRLEVGFEVEVNPLGEAYVTGLTMSPDFPTTAGAYDRTLGGPIDAYVTKFSRDGSAVVYSTFLGGSGLDGSLGLAVDFRGNAYVAGGTSSPDFPTTPGAFDRTFNGETDVYVTKVISNGTALAYSTFVGGAASEGAAGLAVNVRGEAYVTGATTSTDYPTTPGALDTNLGGDSDVFLTKLTANGIGLAYSSYLGGSGSDSGADVAVDLRGAAYLTGRTFSPDFPTTPGAYDSTQNGASDAFVTKISGL